MNKVNLIKIDNIYINPKNVNGLTPSYIHGNPSTCTNIFCEGIETPFIVKRNIDDVAEMLKKDI